MSVRSESSSRSADAGLVLLTLAVGLGLLTASWGALHLPPFDGYRVLRLHSDSDPVRWSDLKGDNRWFESSALHSAVNRNKRDVVVDL